jgi:hypothetical protein
MKNVVECGIAEKFSGSAENNLKKKKMSFEKNVFLFYHNMNIVQ